MLYWFLIGVGILCELVGFALMIKTGHDRQKLWDRLLDENADTAEEQYQAQQKARFAKPQRLSLSLIVAGLLIGALAQFLR